MGSRRELHEQRNRNRFISSFHFLNNLRSCEQYLHGTVLSSFSVACIYFVYTFIYNIFYLPISSEIFRILGDKKYQLKYFSDLLKL